MPIPIILGVGAAIAGAAGVGSGIHGGMKMKKAKDTMSLAEERHQENIQTFEVENKSATLAMDYLGKKEMEVLNSFTEFQDTFERIQNRPEFKAYHKDGVKIPQYDGEELKKVSVGAGLLLAGIGGAGLGAAGGFAAAGATTAAVMALGTASTGTAIASLSGVAATNATLAALGGGTLAAGGGGMALGSAILGGATLGVGLLVGGVIFSITGASLSNKADEAWNQMIEAEKEIQKICNYLSELKDNSKSYAQTIGTVYKVYSQKLTELSCIVNVCGKTDWNDFSPNERLVAENTALLVGLLYNMCKVQLVKQTTDKNGMNQINTQAISNSITDANSVLREKGLA